MIRINLLPVKVSKKRESGRQQLAFFLLIIVGAGVGLYSWNEDLSSSVNKLNARVKKSNRIIAGLRKSVKSMHQFKKQEKALADLLNSVTKLNKQKVGPVRLMINLSRIIPPKVWLLYFKEKKKRVSIKAVALDYDDLYIFERNLKNSKYFYDVKIVGRTKQSSSPINGVYLIKFKIKCRVKYMI